MVKVCDAIMGAGKSQSAITYMNTHSDEKFIYITPYLDEAARIRRECPALNFIEPSSKISEYNFKKGKHTEALIHSGKNITSTHQAFIAYTPEMLDDIKRQKYTLIIDESVDMLEQFSFNPDDLSLMVDAGYIEENKDSYSPTEKKYSGDMFLRFFSLIRSRQLIKIEGDKNNLFYWVLSPELITSFTNVFILTYLFKGQSLHHFLEIYDIPYEYIGIEKTDEEPTGFRFSGYPGYTPEYVSHLGDMIHILDTNKINDVGDNHNALSMSWFERGGENVEQLRRNISNCFKNIWSDTPKEERLWGTYKCQQNKMKGKGYTKSFLAFNSKATNDYRNRTHLVYIVNLFMNVSDKRFYRKYGIDINEDIFALSVMVQWIWRSAIRDGKEIYLYIPSRRMRNILIDWIDTVSKGGNVID